jgi:hypothetical protein
MFMGCAGMSTVGGQDLIPLPEVVRLQPGDNRVFRLPAHMLTLLREEHRFSDLEAIDLYHGLFLTRHALNFSKEIRRRQKGVQLLDGPYLLTIHQIRQ